ncbi:MAG TPA: zinc-ribbon domain-containing protein [Anaerolineales bacterium]|nr:zinc-ribbon domain-containing protein [Anaerolineales bacterium]
MDLGSIFLILALLILVGVYVGRPLIEDKRNIFVLQETEDHNRSMLMAERDRILNALQELDFDHALGKIPEEDYPQQRTMLLTRGATILRELDALAIGEEHDTVEVRLEAAISARRADLSKTAAQDVELVTAFPEGQIQPGERKVATALLEDDDLEVILAQRKRLRQDKAAGFCPQCGSSVQRSDRFCPKCGSKTA